MMKISKMTDSGLPWKTWKDVPIKQVDYHQHTMEYVMTLEDGRHVRIGRDVVDEMKKGKHLDTSKVIEENPYEDLKQKHIELKDEHRKVKDQMAEVIKELTENFREELENERERLRTEATVRERDLQNEISLLRGELQRRDESHSGYTSPTISHKTYIKEYSYDAGHNPNDKSASSPIRNVPEYPTGTTLSSSG